MMKKYFVGGTFILFIFSASLGYAAQDVMPLSLKQCVDLALKNNVEVLTAHTREQQAKGQQRHKRRLVEV